MEVKYSKTAKKEERKFRTSSVPKEVTTYKNFIMEKQQLEAANNLSDYSVITRKPVLQFHKLTADFVGCYAIGLSNTHRMILSPIDSKAKAKCYEVLMKHSIYDYHKN